MEAAETLTETPPAEIPSPTAVQAAEETAPAEAEETSAAVETEPPAPAAPEVKFDPYEALEHAEMKPVLAQRDKRRERDIRADLDSEYSDKTRNWESTQTANTLAGYFGSLFQKLADADSEGFDRSVQSLTSFAGPLMEDYGKAVKKQSANEAAQGLYHYMSEGLKTRDRDAFESFIDGPKVGWPDAFKEYVRLATAEESTKKDQEIARLNDVVEKMKAEGRTGKGINLAASTPGGGGGFKTLYEAQVAHSEKRITNDEMRAIRAKGLPAR